MEIVRLQNICLKNFKNVEYGNIPFDGFVKKNYFDYDCEIIGIYGQNGSGKTAVINALTLLKNCINAKNLSHSYADFIAANSDSSDLTFTFYCEIDSNKFLLDYQIKLKKGSKKNLVLAKESISYKKLNEGKWSAKTKLIDYDIEHENQIIKPQKIYSALLNASKNNLVDLAVSKKLSQEKSTTYVFFADTLNIFSSSLSKNSDLNLILSSLKRYAKNNLVVITNESINVINAMQTSNTTQKESKLLFGEYNIDITKPSIMEEKIFTDTILPTLDRLNIVLTTIIPGMTIKAEQYGKQLLENTSFGVRFELVSVRDEVKIPLRYESEGIKKIISILNAVISVYNNYSYCLVIDELDAGFFEYLLGELLITLQDSGKGQLIFTSHNLRALEMLRDNSLIFTTTNPKRRYIRFFGKNNANLRNLYLRSVELGGQSENMYMQTDSFEIGYALKKASRGSADD